MSKKKKIVIFVLLTPLFLIALATLALEGTYYYQISNLNPEKASTNETYNQLAHDAYWVSTGEDRVVDLESYSTSGYILRVLTSAILPDTGSKNRLLPVGSSLAFQLAKNIPTQHKEHETAFSWHLRNWIVSVWISKNHTAKDAINYQLTNANFGNNQQGIKKAAFFYFSKDINDLTSNEILSLIALEKGKLTKSILECPLKKLENRANHLLEDLKKYNEAKYSNLIYTLPEFNNSANMLCIKP